MPKGLKVFVGIFCAIAVLGLLSYGMWWNQKIRMPEKAWKEAEALYESGDYYAASGVGIFRILKVSLRSGGWLVIRTAIRQSRKLWAPWSLQINRQRSLKDTVIWDIEPM